MRGERVVIAANEAEVKEWGAMGSDFVIVNVAHGPRVVEGMRVRSIDITENAPKHPGFYEMYVTLRRSQLMMGSINQGGIGG